MTIVRLDEVTKVYGRSQRVLDAVTLDAAEGRRAVVLGTPGSGKTTLIKLMGLLMSPTEGTIMVDGQDVREWREPRRARCRGSLFGFVFARHYLMPELSVRENVLLPLRMVGGRWTDQPMADLLAAFELTEKAHLRPAALSRLERQRAALARTLVHGPKIVFADEPCGGLGDADSEVFLADLLALQKQHGFGLVVATSERSAVAQVGGNRVRLTDGLLVPLESRDRG